MSGLLKKDDQARFSIDLGANERSSSVLTKLLIATLQKFDYYEGLNTGLNTNAKNKIQEGCLIDIFQIVH